MKSSDCIQDIRWLLGNDILPHHLKNCHVRIFILNLTINYPCQQKSKTQCGCFDYFDQPPPQNTTNVLFSALALSKILLKFTNN